MTFVKRRLRVGHLSPVLVPVVLALEHHKPASEREEGRVDRRPGEQDSKVESNTGVQVKEDLPAAFDDIMEWPAIAIVEEAGLNVNVVKGC